MNTLNIILKTKNQFSFSAMSDSLQPHGVQYARLPCPSPTPAVCSNSYPSSRWCHPTVSSSVIPFFCLQSFPASGSFLIGQLFAPGGQSIGASAVDQMGANWAQEIFKRLLKKSWLQTLFLFLYLYIYLYILIFYFLEDFLGQWW